MRLTIIRDDHLVGINGEFRTVDLSMLLESGIRAVEWLDDHGHIEYDDSANTTLDNANDFQPFINLWTAAAPPPPTLAELKAIAHARINSAYEAAVNNLTAGYPAVEIASWPIQEAEARAFLADESAPAPWLLAAAEGRGMIPRDLASLIIVNADTLAPLHGALTGKRQRLRDEIDALGDSPTAEQLNAIQW